MKLVWSNKYKELKSALKIERVIKRLTRGQKQTLIKGQRLGGIMGKVLILIVFCFILSGCATTQRSVNPDIQNMQSRIEFLEEEIRVKDQEIGSMQDELREIYRKDTAGYDRAEISAKKAKTRVNDDQLKETIRVDGVTAKQVQRALKNAGFYQGNVDGKVGPKTKEAIKAFQQKNNLTADGIVGKGTWSKLKKNI